MVPGGFETLGFGLWALGLGFGLRAEQLCVGGGASTEVWRLPEGNHLDVHESCGMAATG